jgi:prepilin-type N-terminal cleavage/methylation domain-containing protein
MIDMTNVPRQLKAFTLLELLVAMSLMVVTAACLYTALYTGFRARRSALSAVEPTVLAINAVELLKQDIYGVLPPGDALAGAFLGTDSTGLKGVDTDSLEFYTTHIYADNDHPVGGLGKIELLLEEDTDENRTNYKLLRKVTTNLLSPRGVDPDEQVLCRNVKALDMRYFDGESWLDEWDSTADANSLPLAVEIEVTIAGSTINGAGESQERRLVQSFAIPCGGAASTEEQDDTASGQGGV